MTLVLRGITTQYCKYLPSIRLLYNIFTLLLPLIANVTHSTVWNKYEPRSPSALYFVDSVSGGVFMQCLEIVRCPAGLWWWWASHHKMLVSSPHWGNHETCQDNLACWFGREHHHPAALDQHQVQQKCPHITTEWAFLGYYAICLAVRSKIFWPQIFHALIFPRWMGWDMGTRLTTCVGKYTDMISNQ